MAQRFIEHGVLRLGRIDERAGMLGHRGGNHAALSRRFNVATPTW
jgi:hypothetical protein